MSDIETYPEAGFTDYLVSLLAGLTLGGVAAGFTMAALAGVDYAVAFFELGIAENPVFLQAMSIATLALPGLAALLVAVITYRRVIRMA